MPNEVRGGAEAPDAATPWKHLLAVFAMAVVAVGSICLINRAITITVHYQLASVHHQNGDDHANE